MTTENKIDDGGPAFPCKLNDEVKRQALGAGIALSDPRGMTLRDYFAAKAMAANITRTGDGCHNGYTQEQDEAMLPGRLEFIAKRAYEVSDAMIKARGNTP